MLFQETILAGAWIIELEPVSDHRGFFTRTFCTDEYARHGLETSFLQHSLSGSLTRGTVRGMHFQRPPHEEVKVVTCIKGEVWDVILDLRPDSPTFCRWAGFKLTAENRRRIYIPKGFAHGFQTLSDDAEVSYLISTPYRPESASGVRYDDPAFAIRWPLPVAAISDRDRGWADFSPPRRQSRHEDATRAQSSSR